DLVFGATRLVSVGVAQDTIDDLHRVRMMGRLSVCVLEHRPELSEVVTDRDLFDSLPRAAATKGDGEPVGSMVEQHRVPVDEAPRHVLELVADDEDIGGIEQWPVSEVG